MSTEASTLKPLISGQRIRIVKWAVGASMYDEAESVPLGTLGTVEFTVASNVMGQVAWVRFDNGAKLCVLEEDEFEVVDG